ncbi:phosphatidate cytidylyltransferase [Rhodobacter ferrooxidans]|uniref:Phosphatidate cytidylyltransferase n=1 Tax=Rhodobacter ferrooxidans TaxID=371731 RepID=C8S1D8_9RHOB|nr:phosphatidate cytidylyltransferase [Rhodobacter sp. SW2]EEW25111.1 phosphatidate cytidylyltransferase [Rhodobacter sp. SW2]
MDPAPNRWADLRPRVISATLMVAVGAAALWQGGLAFQALVVAIAALMIWELARMTRPLQVPDVSVPLAALAALCLALVFYYGMGLAALVFLAAPSLVGAGSGRRDQAVYVVYAFVVMLTGYGLVTLHHDHGLAIILWLLLVVVASDLAGYFAGRILGGPKFWPRISPKKTWSGTAAGWLCAVVVGLGFVLAGQGGWGLLWLSPLVAFAGQMGDIGESWIKRRAGVKDSSNLIPGHGGFMDRFDALAGAVVAVLAASLLLVLPIGGQ